MIKWAHKRTLFIEPLYVLALPNPENAGQYEFRPHSREFLQGLSSEWEIVFFSSRKQEDLASLVDALDPLKSAVKFVLDRKQCSITNQKKCVKDISSIMNFDRETSIIVDYKPQNVAYSLEQALVVPHWDGSASDNELPGLLIYLNDLAKQSEPVAVNNKRNAYQILLSMIYKSPTSLAGQPAT